VTDWTVDPEQLKKVKEGPRSVSQVKDYERCPYLYLLARVVKAWERPAAWLPQGLGVHEAAEAHERSGRSLSVAQAQDVFRESYATHTNRLAEETPNLNYWFASGPYAGRIDIERRYELGLDQVARYVDYYETRPDEVIWVTPEGEPAIELGFNIDLDGVQMRGFIDQVISVDDALVVRDIKSGNKPGDAFQLGVYGVAVEQEHGAAVTSGDYWMGRTGKPTKPYELMGRSGIVEKVHAMDEGVKAERFEPDPEPSKCRFCPVAEACKYRMG